MLISHFANRYAAGRRLAEELGAFAGDPQVLVLGLPRGGVPVASRLAEALDAQLDVFVVRKLGVPGYEELALGAIASGGARVLNVDVVDQLAIPPLAIERIIADETLELQRRERVYRGGREFPDVSGRTVIVVDDGAATGASMRVAVLALRRLSAQSIIVALPVASRSAAALMRSVADGLVCIAEPEPFFSVGSCYDDFEQVSDAEVRLHLADAARRQSAPGVRLAGAGT